MRTGVTAPAFSYLRGVQTENEGLVAQIFTGWNLLISALRWLDSLRQASWLAGE